MSRSGSNRRPRSVSCGIRLFGPDHLIKANFTTYSGEQCIYHPPSGAFYGKTKPERCYASGAEAVKDGCRASKR